MGYNYRESGYGSCDYLIVTKKGKEEGRLPDGIVNRFGFFITKTNMFEHGDSDYDIGSGSWFRRKNAPTFKEALKHLD